jgi:hypothetical protein
LEELSREDPKRPEPWAGLGYLAWRSQETKQALELFARAYELGDHNPKLLWDFGRLAERERPEDARRALEELVKLQPENVDARIELASVQMNARQAAQALATVAPITNVTPQQAQRLFSVVAGAELQLGDRAAARATATRLASVATQQQFKDRAAEMLRYLDQTEGRPIVPPQPQPQRAAVATESRPDLVSRSPAPTPIPAAAQAPVAQRPSMQGRIVAMNCSESPTLALETELGTKLFAVIDANKIVLTGGEPGALNLQCGRFRTPVAVRIGYDPVPTGVVADGVLREIHFQ